MDLSAAARIGFGRPRVGRRRGGGERSCLAWRGAASPRAPSASAEFPFVNPGESREQHMAPPDGVVG